MSANKTYPNRSYARCLIARSPSFVLERKRYLTRNEMLKLQGLKETSDCNKCENIISYTVFSKLLGNAMNITVLEELFCALLSHDRVAALEVKKR